MLQQARDTAADTCCRVDPPFDTARCGATHKKFIAGSNAEDLAGEREAFNSSGELPGQVLGHFPVLVSRVEETPQSKMKASQSGSQVKLFGM